MFMCGDGGNDVGALKQVRVYGCSTFIITVAHVNVLIYSPMHRYTSSISLSSSLLPSLSSSSSSYVYQQTYIYRLILV